MCAGDTTSPEQEGIEMNNANIIIQAAIQAGYYTESEIVTLLTEGKMPEFHTYTIWNQLGLCPKKGSHGYETRLWKKKKCTVKENDTECDQGFYLTKALLFHISQCEPIASDQKT